ncbi:hypothetical protein N7492_000567 [Penicillium capsulatum]|uniref:Uncharacterized protein n=1 Tax=Penicillium capsulatum TaxID=69766 RepID=A0A9W9LYN2_9EURO|nr:hypothetical protein N7492_000567 [Penicillium capsulatum]
MSTVEYPPAVLARVNAARHTPPPSEAGSQFYFIVIKQQMDEFEKRPESETIVGQFPTIQEANRFALDYFKREFEHYFTQTDDMANFFEAGRSAVRIMRLNGGSMTVAR